MKKKSIFLYVSLALAIAGIFIWKNLDQEIKGQVSRKQLRLAFYAGMEHRYKIDYKNESQTSFFEFSGEQGQNNGPLNSNYRFELESEWKWKIQANIDGIYLIESLMLPEKMLFEIGGNPRPVEIESFKRETQLPFYFYINLQGKISGIKFPESYSRTTRNTLKAILAESVVQLPAESLQIKEGVSWQSPEEDLNGSYQASYSIVSLTNELIGISKLGKDYSGGKMPGKAKRSMDFDKKITSELKHFYEFEPVLGIIFTLESSEQLNISLENKQVAQSKTSFKLSLLETGRAKSEPMPAKAEAAGKLVEDSLSSAADEQRLERIIQENELGTMDRKEIINALKQAALSNDENKLDELYLKIKALIYLYPGALEEFAQMLKEWKADSYAFKTVLRALGAVGNTEAQNLLVDYLKSEKTSEKQIAYAFELSTVEKPLEKSEEALRQLIKKTGDTKVSESAGLGLGIMAERLGRFDEVRERAIVDDFVGGLKEAKTDAEKSLLLSALGNSGSAYAEETLMQAIGDDKTSLSLRSEALRSLRFLPGEHITQKIIEGLESNDEEIQTSAAFALGFRSPESDAVERQKQVFEKSKNLRLQQELLNNIWEARSLDQSNIQFVQNVAEEHPQESTREQARGLLSTLSNP